MGFYSVVNNNTLQANEMSKRNIRRVMSYIVDNSSNGGSNEQNRMKIFLRGCSIYNNEGTSTPTIYGTQFVSTHPTLLDVLKKTSIQRNDTQVTISAALGAVNYRLRFGILGTLGNECRAPNLNLVLLRSLTPWHIPSFRYDMATDANELRRADIQNAVQEHQHIYPNQDLITTRTYEEMGYIRRTGCTTLEDGELVYGEDTNAAAANRMKHWDLQIWSSYTMRVNIPDTNRFIVYSIIDLTPIKDMVNQFTISRFPDENVLLYN